MKGSIRKRGKTWMFTVDVGVDERGKRKQKVKSGFKTKKEAEQACNELINQLTTGTYIEPRKCKLKEFLTDWLETTAKQRLRLTTYDTYKLIIDLKIIPILGNISLEKLTPMQIQKFYARKLAEGLSAEYVRYMHAILHNSLNQAVKWKMIPSNPVSLTSPPKIEHKEKLTWTIAEANQFLKRTEKESLLHIAYLLAIYTGMRQGEILGLRWKDCDLEKGRISIRQTLVNTSKGLLLQEPKTKSSRRVVAITEDIVEALKKHKLQQNKNKLLLGPDYQDNNLVVCTSKGTPMLRRNFVRHFHRMIEESGVPKIRFHDIRHTHATIMLQLGEHPKVVSERLGHSNTNVTLDTYSHVIPNIQADAAKNFSNALKATQ